MKYSTLLLLLMSHLLIGQSQQRHSKILIDIDRPNIVQYLNDQGMAIDHTHKHGNQLEVVVSDTDLNLLSSLDVNYNLVELDLAKAFEKLVAAQNPDLKMDCGLVNFDQGSMSNYHTYDDMRDHVYTMQLLYPQLVNVTTIGKTHEDRDILAVKISDNVGTDESDNESTVYYDAITHAREPMGLETILFYMWTLLENYGTDETLTYLVDNREIYFVPVVNPDGYVFNQTTNPNGGGFWRKNTRDNGDGTFGVDLNRNYGHGWGLDIGSSANPQSDTYRGPEAFSEPETQTIRDFTTAIKPTAAFSNHTFSDVFLCPLGYSDIQPDHDLYSEFALDMLPEGYQGYGNWQQMIFYYGSGSAHDYLHSEGIVAMTPEIGHSFWEDPAVICDRVQEMLPSMTYLSWISGAYAVYQNHKLTAESIVWEGKASTLQVRLKNKGLGLIADDVVATLSCADPRVSILNPVITVGDIEERSFSDLIDFNFEITEPVIESEALVFTIEVTQEGILTSSDDLVITTGQAEILFNESGENGIDAWQGGNGQFQWDTTHVAAFDGNFSIADSPLGNHKPNQNNSLIMSTPINLTGMAAPWLEFSAKWSLEPEIDYVELKLSDDGGNNWFLLNGANTNGSGKYTGHQTWVRERIDLDKHVDKSNIILGFFINADASREADGFYFDDLNIVNYANVDMVSTQDAFEANIDIFPNPTDAFLNFNFNKSIDQVQISIFDHTGQLVKSHTIQHQTATQMDIKDLHAGTYLCQIQMGDQVVYEKIVLSK